MTNDFRRTLLLVVFSMSLVFLWDKWNLHTGGRSMFSPAPAASAPVAAASAPGAIPTTATAVTAAGAASAPATAAS